MSGIPSNLHTDNDPQFPIIILASVCTYIGVKHLRKMAYLQQANSKSDYLIQQSSHSFNSTYRTINKRDIRLCKTLLTRTPRECTALPTLHRIVSYCYNSLPGPSIPCATIDKAPSATDKCSTRTLGKPLQKSTVVSRAKIDAKMRELHYRYNLQFDRSIREMRSYTPETCGFLNDSTLRTVFAASVEAIASIRTTNFQRKPATVPNIICQEECYDP